MRRRFVLLGSSILILAALGIYALLHRAPVSFMVQQSLANFTEKGVTVEIALEQDQARQVWLASTFTPTQPGFHVYSTDLPRGGIDGVGRPTLLEIITPPDLHPLVPLQADQPVHDLYFDILQRSFPVYPDGPVTVRLPITKPDRPVIPIELSVTYMACSDTTCLPPVENKLVSVTLRGGRE